MICASIFSAHSDIGSKNTLQRIFRTYWQDNSKGIFWKSRRRRIVGCEWIASLATGCFFIIKTEGSHSGLVRSLGKRICLYRHHRFESCTLRFDDKKSNLGFCEGQNSARAWKARRPSPVSEVWILPPPPKLKIGLGSRNGVAPQARP